MVTGLVWWVSALVFALGVLLALVQWWGARGANRGLARGEVRPTRDDAKGFESPPGIAPAPSPLFIRSTVTSLSVNGKVVYRRPSRATPDSIEHLTGSKP